LWNLNLKLELVYSLMDILSSSLPRGSMGEGRLIWKFTRNGKFDVSLEECLAQQSHQEGCLCFFFPGHVHCERFKE
jgi:hypothetical protein